ncbi:MAG: hypothetical protein KDJ31_08470, partial [Candidatus Competibacteraceae bacterium]|nr:hypothetical protein [Candidatus Competibacteraceae bacterium]
GPVQRDQGDRATGFDPDILVIHAFSPYRTVMGEASLILGATATARIARERHARFAFAYNKWWRMIPQARMNWVRKDSSRITEGNANTDDGLKKMERG